MDKQIEHLVDTFNGSWPLGKLDAIAPLLHDQVIFVAPDLRTEIIGKEACLQSIGDYVNNAQTNFFDVRSRSIHVWEQAASVSIEYHIEYALKGETYRETGHEFWLLNKQKDDWKMVLRALVSSVPRGE